MFSRIIVATDLSPASFAVVNCVGGLRTFGARECLLLQCVNVHEAASSAFSYTTRFLEENMAEQKGLLEKQGFAVKAHVAFGSPKTEIGHIAREEGYSLVVVGSRGHSLIGETLLGGVAEAVIRHATVPVLLLRLDVKKDGRVVCCQADRCDFVEHVLYPTDFSENADRAFPYVEKIVADGAKRVTLLHVQDRTRIDPHLHHRLDEFNEIDQGRLAKLKARLVGKGDARIDTEVVFSHPIQEVLRVIREQDVRLVLMGSQGRGFVEEIFLGSVSHNVARHSDAAVMLIPAKRS